MKMTIDMPYVSQCTISDCAYNINQSCHARAITIGDGVHPGCDTALRGAAEHTRSANLQAGVGACKVTGCTFNDDFECMAESISVGISASAVRCLTYHAR